MPVRWSDIDMYQHVNHGTMVTILERVSPEWLVPWPSVGDGYCPYFA